MNISNFVTLLEATKSQTATRLGIENNPDEETIERMKYVAKNVFDKVRMYFDVPIGVSSFYRCDKLNKAIGGSPTSQHVHGEAIDIDADMYGVITNKQIFDYIHDNLEYDQIISEFGTREKPAWVHVSLKKQGNRKQALRAFINSYGKTSYQEY